jgi:ABC-type uncharacterized transport system permease subunit
VPGATWFWAAIALYAAAGALFLAFLAGVREIAGRIGTGVLAAAFVAHMCEIGARGFAGLHPVSSVGDALGFLAWLTVGGLLLSQLRWRLHNVGAFVAPGAAVMLLAARLSPGGAGSTDGLGLIGRVHIFLATTGVAVFALATAVAIVYLFQERQLKRRHLGAMVKKGVALETLDMLVHRAVVVGFPVFTIAVLTGGLWTAQRAGGIRPEYGLAMLAWGAFGAMLVARQAAGWRGRRAALLTVGGFAAAVVVLGLYLARGAGGG